MTDEPWHRFYFPSTIEWGTGCAKSVGKRLVSMKASRPLVVTDAGVMDAGIVDEVLEVIHEAGLHETLFSDVLPNPTDKAVYAGTVRYQEGRCDSLVAIGGGSVIDAAKAIRMVVAHSASLQELYADAGGMERMRRPMPRLIAIPTTAGTGSEVSRGAVITDTSSHRKRLLIHPRQTATIALLDPMMTLHLSPFLTATTGADALAHCIEGYVSTTCHPVADGIALEGIRLIWKNLPKVVQQPQNVSARGKMLLAAAMGALAFQKGGGIGHALANPLSESANIPHGLANAIVLPTVMEFNVTAVPERYAAIAQAMGVRGQDDSEEAAAYAAIEATREFLASLNMPTSLSEAGLKREQIPRLASEAIRDESHGTNPRPCTENDLRQLYEAAL